MRARLHVRGHRLGFFRENSHDVCDARATRQLLPATSDALDRLMAAMRSLGLDAVREIELSENVDASRAGGVPRRRRGARRLDARASGRHRRVDRPRVGLRRVRQPVRDRYADDRRERADAAAARASVLPGQPPSARRSRRARRRAACRLAARCSISTPASGCSPSRAAVIRGASVVAVEGDAYAAADLHANAAARGRPDHHGARRGRRHCGRDVRRVGPGGRPPAAETVIVDPPRTGMSREALDKVLR